MGAVISNNLNRQTQWNDLQRFLARRIFSEYLEDQPTVWEDCRQITKIAGNDACDLVGVTDNALDVHIKSGLDDLTNCEQKTQIVDALCNAVGVTDSSLMVYITGGIELEVALDYETDTVTVYGCDSLGYRHCIRVDEDGDLQVDTSYEDDSMLVYGCDGECPHCLAVDEDGHLQIDVLSGPPALTDCTQKTQIVDALCNPVGITDSSLMVYITGGMELEINLDYETDSLTVYGCDTFGHQHCISVDEDGDLQVDTSYEDDSITVYGCDGECPHCIAVDEDGHLQIDTALTTTTPLQITKTVGSTTVPEAIAAISTSFQSATIFGKSAPRINNADTVYLGVTMGNESQPIEIEPGERQTIEAPAGQQYDWSDWYLDVEVGGDGIIAIYS